MFNRQRKRERETNGVIAEKRKARATPVPERLSIGWENRPSRFSGSSFVETDFLVRRADRKTRDTRYGDGLERGYIAYVYLRRNGGDDSARRDTETEECNWQLGQAGFSPVLLARHHLSYLISRSADISRYFSHFFLLFFFFFSYFVLLRSALGRNFVGGSPLSATSSSTFSKRIFGIRCVRKWSVANREMVY